MFRRALIGALLLLCLTGGLAFFFLFRPDDKATMAYSLLEQSSRPTQNHNEMKITEHRRKGVVKELFSEHFIPENVRVFSETSELYFVGEGKNIEIIEEMQNVLCLFQEELLYLLPNGKKIGVEETPPQGSIPLQRLCLIEAENATFYYGSNNLLAQKVKMQKYETNGHALPSNLTSLTPIMEGEAHTVEVGFYKGEISLAASPFKAIFEMPEKTR